VIGAPQTPAKAQSAAAAKQRDHAADPSPMEQK
jgi:hypothetical protein